MPVGWVQSPSQATTSALGVAVAVTIPNRAQIHCGVVHQLESDPARLLHLEWHARLADVPWPPSDEYLWVPLRLHAIRRDAVIAKCRLIATARPSISYGVQFDGARFLENGLVQYQGSTHGMTCATFVLAVLDSAGVPLLKTADWKSRPEDAAWHDWIVAQLRKTAGVSKAHADNVAAEKGCARFRPEEVAGACAGSRRPLGFVIVPALGRLVRDCLKATVAVPNDAKFNRAIGRRALDRVISWFS